MQHITIRNIAALALALALAAPGGALAAELSLSTGDRLTLEAGETLSGGLTVAGGATLAGGGTVAGGTFVAGTMEVGTTDAEAAILTFEGGLTLNAGAFTILDLLGADEYDKIAVTGSAMTQDGQLKIVLASSYTPSGVAVFDVIQSAGGIQGVFSNVADSRVTPYLSMESLAPVTFLCTIRDLVTLRLSGFSSSNLQRGTVYSIR